MRKNTTRFKAALLAAALGAGMLASGAQGGADSPRNTYIIAAEPGELTSAEAAVRANGGNIVSRLDVTNGLIIELDADEVTNLADARGVRGVTIDRAIESQWRPDVTNRRGRSGSMHNVAETISSRGLWEKNGGHKIGIAVVDTGIDSSHPALDDGKIRAAVDFSGENNPALDGTGHGTYIASIIAGNENYVADQKSKWHDYYNDPGAFTGVAPDAHLINVKVADATGETTSAKLLAGLEWIYDHADDKDLNIRVVNLSFGAPATDDPLADPLNVAVESLWDAGIVVVVSAGNHGNDAGLMSPAIDSYVIAVGSSDSGLTPTPWDDSVTPFSASDPVGRSIDLLAPGRSIEGALAAGSSAQAATGNLGNGYIVGSGTSQSAAVVSGSIAILLDKKSAEPDEVKAKLLLSANELPGVARQLQGAGIVNVAEAADTKVKKEMATQNHPRAHGRNGQSEMDSSEDVVDWNGNRWTGNRWTGNRWTGNRWLGFWD